MVQIGGDKKGKIRNVQLEKLVQVGFHDKGDLVRFFVEMLADFFIQRDRPSGTCLAFTRRR